MIGTLLAQELTLNSIQGSKRGSKTVMASDKRSQTWIWLIAINLVLTLPEVHGQNDLYDVHIVPRVESANADTLASLQTNSLGTIHTRVEIVLVPVTVMDGAYRVVTGLKRENFYLYEDKRPQSIKHLWREDEPVSVGIVLDVSGSMATKMDRAQNAVRALLGASNPQDEFFLMTFADRPRLVEDFTQNTDEIQNQLLFVKPKGHTSLLDAIVLAVNNMTKARYQRKALVIISDGGDNQSRYSEKDVKSLLKEADVLAYSVGIFDAYTRTIEERLGPELLAEISNLTGASAYTLDNPANLPMITQHIAAELRNQYILAYSPDDPRHNGGWRKIKVKLRSPIQFLHVQARNGYYGPAD
jgi:Ca-activated chloride channel homolog